MHPLSFFPVAGNVITCATMLREQETSLGSAAPKGGWSMSSRVRVGVLVVEDYEPFRRFICSTLGKRPELQILGEASNGLRAVQKAEELRPDLILLDIGLPTLNGIEAAHQISRLVPAAKVLFVSQNNDADVVKAALSDGAKGYVRKENALTDLLPAIEAVLRGDRFVSRGLHTKELPQAKPQYGASRV
jgi:DNA-binding NarL/FixJ family response regulator